MDNNKIIYAKENAILYKTSDDEVGWNIRWLNDTETSCEEVCKKEHYAKTYCLYLDKEFLSSDLHLRTEIINFDGKFYFPDELIPYPNTEPKNIEKFEVFMEWEDEKDFFEGDYDEVYNGVEQLWTDVITKFSANDNMDEFGIVAQIFIEDFPKFMEKLKQNNQAVYDCAEYSPFKWLAWVINDKVRLIHQDYRSDKVKTEFDVLINKENFYTVCENMVAQMSEYAEKDLKRYNEYVNYKYKK